jgi:hypothetical protein
MITQVFSTNYKNVLKVQTQNTLVALNHILLENTYTLYTSTMI